MPEPTRSATILVDRLLQSPELLERAKSHPDTLRTLAEEVTKNLRPPVLVSDLWTYQVSTFEPSLVHPNWLHRVANDIQALAGCLADEPDIADLERSLMNLPPAATRLESIVLRGLKAEAMDVWRTAPRPFARYELAARAREILETRYREAWSVKGLAREVGCNRTVLEEAFTHLTSTTVHAFLVKYRVNEARSLLVRTADGVKGIAARVGFSEPTLIRQFRRLTGMSPTEYRRCNRHH